MYNSNTKKWILLLGTGIALILFLVFINGMTGENARLNRRIQTMGGSGFSIALYNEGLSYNENAHVIQELRIDGWLDKESSTIYLFMPSAIDVHAFSGWKVLFGGCDKANIDGKEYSSGDAFALNEGTHVLIPENDGSYVLEVLYSEGMASLFIDVEGDELTRIRESRDYAATGSFTLLDEKGMPDATGEIEDIHTRGNLSFTETDKKSFAMKLKNKEDFLGMGKSKRWLLLANAFDDTLSRNYITSRLADAIDMAYVPDMEFVDLYMNGEYQGNYQLSEKVEIADGRLEMRNLEEETYSLNVEEDVTQASRLQEEGEGAALLKYTDIEYIPSDNRNGYLLELDMLHRFEDKVSGFLSAGHQPVVMKSPEYAGFEQVSYVAKLYQEMEDALNTQDGYNAITGKYFYEYMDMDSFAQKYLIDEVTKNTDSSLSSFYVYMPDKDGRFYGGPIWDYDKSLGANEERDGYYMNDPVGLYAAEDIELLVCADREHSLYYLLCNQEAFQEAYRNLYFERMRMAALDAVDTWIPENAQRLEASVIMDVIRWKRFGGVCDREVLKELYMEKQKEIGSFLEKRIAFLDEIWK